MHIDEKIIIPETQLALFKNNILQFMIVINMHK